MRGKELDPALVDLFLNCEAFIAREDEQNHGGEILTKEQNGVNQLILNGDFSITGVNEQLSILAQHLAGVAEVVPGAINRHLPYEVDLSGVQVLDTCGCQLLAVILRSLRQRGVGRFSLKLSDDDRDKIHSLGFADEIFAGECS
jgi:ABC-type transporter Mla MlaB component